MRAREAPAALHTRSAAEGGLDQRRAGGSSADDDAAADRRTDGRGDPSRDILVLSSSRDKAPSSLAKIICRSVDVDLGKILDVFDEDRVSYLSVRDYGATNLISAY